MFVFVSKCCNLIKKKPIIKPETKKAKKKKQHDNLFGTFLGTDYNTTKLAPDDHLIDPRGAKYTLDRLRVYTSTTSGYQEWKTMKYV